MATPNLSVNLPWGTLAAGGNAMAGVGGDPAAAMAQLGGLYNQNYQASLGLNAGLSQGIQGGFEGLRKNVDQQYADIHKGYQDVYGDVLGRIAGTNATNLNDINTAYNAQSGASSQDLINRGLGNSTVQMSMQRGIEQDRQRALLASQNQFAQLGAGYASQIGQAGLAAQQQGVGLGANLGLAQLGSLERTNIPYPDAGMYMNLAHMYGANLQRQQDQKAANQAQNQLGGGMFSRSGISGVSGGSHGYAPLAPSGVFGLQSPWGQPGGAGMDVYSGVSSPAPAYQPPASWGFSGGGAWGSQPDVGQGYAPAPLGMGAVGGGAMAGLGFAGFGGPQFEGGDLSGGEDFGSSAFGDY